MRGKVYSINRLNPPPAVRKLLYQGYTVVWKTFGIKKFRMAHLLRNLNTRALFHYKIFHTKLIYLHFLFSGPFSEHMLAIFMALLKYLKPAKDRLRFVTYPWKRSLGRLLLLLLLFITSTSDLQPSTAIVNPLPDQ